jgi:hypothetical protein
MSAALLILALLGFLVFLFGGLLAHSERKRDKRRRLRKEARQFDQLLSRTQPKAYRALGGSRGPAENHAGKTKVGF